MGRNDKEDPVMNVGRSIDMPAPAKALSTLFPRTSPRYLACLQEISPPTEEDCKPLHDLLQGRVPEVNEKNAAAIMSWCMKRQVLALMREIQRDYDFMPRLEPMKRDGIATIQTLVDAGIRFDASLKIKSLGVEGANEIGNALAMAGAAVRELAVNIRDIPASASDRLSGLTQGIESCPALHSVSLQGHTSTLNHPVVLNSLFEAVRKNPVVESLTIALHVTESAGEALRSVLDCGHLRHVRVLAGLQAHRYVVTAIVENARKRGGVQPVSSLELGHAQSAPQRPGEVEALGPLASLTTILQDGQGVSHLRLPHDYVVALAARLSEEDMSGNRDLTSLEIESKSIPLNEGISQAFPEDFAARVVARNKAEQLMIAAENIRWASAQALVPGGLPGDVATRIANMTTADPGPGAMTLLSLRSMNPQAARAVHAHQVTLHQQRMIAVVGKRIDGTCAEVQRLVAGGLEALQEGKTSLPPGMFEQLAHRLREQAIAAIEKAFTAAASGPADAATEGGVKRADEEARESDGRDAKRPKN